MTEELKLSDEQISELLNEYRKARQEKTKLWNGSKGYRAGIDSLEIYISMIGLNHVDKRLDALRKTLTNCGISEQDLDSLVEEM